MTLQQPVIRSSSTHSSGMVFIHFFHKRLPASVVLSGWCPCTTLSVNAFSYIHGYYTTGFLFDNPIFEINYGTRIVNTSATSFFTRISQYFIILDPIMLKLCVKKWLKYVVCGTKINRLCQDNSRKIAGKKNFIQLLNSEEIFRQNSDSCYFFPEQFS